MDQVRWSVRGVDQEVIEILHEVAETSGLTIGEALNEAVQVWYEGLPEVIDEQAPAPAD